MKDPTEFKQRFAAWKAGKKVYDAGKPVEDDYEKFKQTLPPNQRNASEYEYSTRRYWELNGKPKNFDEAVKRGMYSLEDDGYWHAGSIAWTPEGDAEFMKSNVHPTKHFEDEFYESNPEFLKKYRRTLDWTRPGFSKYERNINPLDHINLPHYDGGTDDKTYLPEYEYEATVTPQGTSVLKHKRITNEEDWLKYWGDVGAGYVSLALESVAKPILEGLKTASYFTPLGNATAIGDFLAANINGDRDEVLASAAGLLPQVRWARNAYKAGKQLMSLNQLWDRHYFHALNDKDLRGVKNLRDAHFIVNAPNTKIKNGDLPVTLYHGTPNKGWNEYDPKFFGSNTDDGYYGKGLYLTETLDDALAYAGIKDRNFEKFTGTKNPYLKRLYVNSETPFVSGALNNDFKIATANEASDRAMLAPHFGRDLKFKIGTPGSESGTVYIPNDMIYDPTLVRELENADASIFSNVLHHVDRDPTIVKFDEVIVPKSSLMKYVDPITYDDFGNIIPLSMRDNFFNPDFRFDKGKSIRPLPKYDDGTDAGGYDTENKVDVQKEINWMRNWLNARRDILEKNADAVGYGYSKYTPKNTTGDVREAGWNVERYDNPWNPFTYFNNSTPSRNRVNKLIYSQIENAENTPKTSVGHGLSSDYNMRGVYVLPDYWDNSGNYIAFAGIPDSGVKIHELTHASHPLQQEYYILDNVFNGKVPLVVPNHKRSDLDNAKELYGALQQFRYENKLDPKYKVTQEWINKNRDLFKGTYLENIKDSDKLKLFNDVAQNNINTKRLYYADKGKSIHINPANKGKFNATKKRTGKTTEQLAHSKNPLTRKRAIFALNARKWKH